MNLDRLMCHRCQNSLIVFARYGALKFCVIEMPNMRATPSAMSEYPLKSK